MRSKGQETGGMDKGCMVLIKTRHIIHETLSCRPNPLDLPDEFVPKEPEELNHKGA